MFIGHLPAGYQPWVLNLILHWTFGLELLVCLAVAILRLRERRAQ